MSLRFSLTSTGPWTGPGASSSRWVIRRMRIDDAWYTGDPVAIFGG